jgi:peptidoglycan/LPS O-acetylase OafA/YrhL
VAGRWAYGVAVARIFVAVLLGRLRPLAWLLSLDLWLPIAGLSYGAYLLQNWALLVPPSWASAGVTSLWAAWGTGLLAFLVVVALSLASALPLYLLVEMPFSKLWPRRWQHSAAPV